MCDCDCRRNLQVETLTVADGVFTITISQQPLNDGKFYSLRLDQAFPTLTGTETVEVVNGTETVQLVDRRARQILSERVLRRGERLRMIFTQNSIGAVPVFMVVEGIVPLP